jgi:glycosyltransferase involved in cell wall biosynthesis
MSASVAEPRVSVVIPVFNRPEAVCRSIASALAQTETALEILVVDDASTDGTADAVRQFADPRVRLFVQPFNQGGGAARNRGIDEARAPLVAFLDSDDTWMPEKIAQNLAFAATLQASHPDGRWLLYNQLEVQTDERTYVTQGATGAISQPVDEFLFIDRGPMQTSSAMLPTALARQVRFDDTLRRLQDWDFYLRLGAAGCRFYGMTAVLSRHEARSFGDRVSRGANPAWLLAWQAERRHLMTPRGQIGFRANKVAPEAFLAGDHALAWRCLMEGVRGGAMHPRTALIEGTRMALGEQRFEAVRQRWHQLRSRAR